MRMIRAKDGASQSEVPRVCLTGRFGLVGPGGLRRTFRFQEAASLLAFLAWNLDRPMRRADIASLIWEGEEDADVGHRLRECLRALRIRLRAQGISDEAIAAHGDTIRLCASHFTTDVALFRADVAEGRKLEEPSLRLGALEAALAGLGSEFLPQCAASWSHLPRVHFERELADVQAEVVELLLAVGRPADAIEKALEVARRLPADETAQSRAMRLLHASGRSAEAIELFEAFERFLDEEFGLSPGAAAYALLDSMFVTGTPRRREPAREPLPSGLLGRPRLPLADVVGRDTEIETIVAALTLHPHARRRLVTVYGIGGLGKTSVANEAANRVHEATSWPVLELEFDGFVESSSVWQLAMHAATGCEVPEPESQAAFLRLVGDQPCLLLLHSCEFSVHGIEAFVESILSHCPNARILASSRTRLRCEGQLPLHLPPLAVPGPEATAEEILASPAGRLLSRTVEECGGVLHASDAQSLRQILGWSGGVPLSIRLAAGWLSTRSAVPLATALVSDETNPGPVPHLRLARGTVEDAVVNACESLSPGASRCALALGLLADGFTSEDACAILGDSEGHAHMAEVEAAQLLARTGDPGHFYMLCPVRRSLRNAARRQGLTSELWARIAGWIAQRLAYAWPEPWLGSSVEALAPYRAIHRTTVATLEAALDGDLRAADAVRLLGTLKPAVESRKFPALWAKFAPILSTVREPESEWLTSARLTLAADAFYRNDPEAMLEQLDRCPPADALPPSMQAALHLSYGVAHRLRGEPVAARSRYLRAIATASDYRIDRAYARAQFSLARLEEADGRPEAAIVRLEEALATGRLIGDAAMEAACLESLGDILASEGRYAEARDLLEKAHRLAIRAGDDYGAALVLADLGAVLLWSGEWEAAVENLSEAIKTDMRLGLAAESASNGCHLAWALAECGRLDEAGRLLESLTDGQAWAGSDDDRAALHAAAERIGEHAVRRLRSAETAKRRKTKRVLTLEPRAEAELRGLVGAV